MDEWFVQLPARKADIPHFGGAARRRIARHLPTWPNASEPQLSLAPPMPMATGPADTLVDPLTALGAVVHPGSAPSSAALGTSAAIGISTLGHPAIGHAPIGTTTSGSDDEPLPTTEELIRLSRLRNGWLSKDELGKLRKSLS